ncbi:MAG: hypothetical protein ACF8TS_22015 [Maioricimonas sp. JB049]
MEGYEGTTWLLQRLIELSGAPESTGDAAASPTSDPPEEPSTPDEPRADDEPSAKDANAPGSAAARSPAPAAPVMTASGTGSFLFTLAELALVIGGSAATGGAGTAVAVGLARLLLRGIRRRKSRRCRDAKPERKEDELFRAPFPRALDEARELLAIRQSEGRVAVLDALRGMFLDDECDRLIEQGEDCEIRTVRQLRERVDARVDEVAPLSVRAA